MKVVYTAETAKTSTWWKSLSPSAQERYLKRHPNSKFAAMQRKGKIQRALKVIEQVQKETPTGEKPKKPKPKSKSPSKHLKAMSPDDRKKTVEAVHEALPKTEEFQKIQNAVDQPAQKLGKKKLRKIANIVREAIGSENGKKVRKALHKSLKVAGVATVIGAAAFGLGVPVGVYVPALVERAWQNITSSKDDLVLVSNLKKAVSDALKEPHSTEDVEKSLRDLEPPEAK